METKELLKAPQLFVVYAIAILYTITFYLAAVISPSADNAAWGLQGINQVAKLETNSTNRSQVVRNNSLGLT
ncbi:hypothetical protein [Nitrosomonas sp. Nm166]|uniref:hypothetical protein n=1 Tax=Nitrosomonas sp. Nm166 TaxID=1881054 RepID=UPI0008EC2104|nr:hypothetical protein [Nitrosomonas sp. Nm166]SFE31097.1 hypothetical protein SAMN05428977_101223 [Nitrosomonas sp. Nm166]